MNNNDKNIFDKFLGYYDNLNNRNKIYQRVYKKPSKVKCIIGFIFSILFLIFLIRLFAFSFLYFFLLLADLLILAFYSLNLFTKKGLPLPTTIPVKQTEAQSIKENTEQATTNHEGIYRIDK